MKYLNTKYHMNNVQTLPCFLMLSLAKLATDLRQADGCSQLRSVYVISGRHLLSTQKSSSRRKVQCCSRGSFSPRRRPGRSFQPAQAWYCKFFFCFFFYDYDLKLFINIPPQSVFPPVLGTAFIYV